MCILRCKLRVSFVWSAAAPSVGGLLGPLFMKAGSLTLRCKLWICVLHLALPWMEAQVSFGPVKFTQRGVHDTRTIQVGKGKEDKVVVSVVQKSSTKNAGADHSYAAATRWTS